MSEIVVEGVRAEGGRVSYDYDYSPDLRRFFADDLVVEYDVDVSDVPERILAIPLVANLCPVAWATGADVYVPRIDETFFHALTDVRSGFETLYPELIRDSTVYAKEVVDGADDAGEAGANAGEATDPEERSDDAGTGVLFSGGVDSLATYLRHREAEPTLLSVHGFDFTFDQDVQWAERRELIRDFGETRGLENRFVRMNMQEFLNLVMLNAHFGEHYDDNWITSVHHGLSLLGTCAPIAAVEGLDTLYIAASHWDGFDHPWGSHPEIDEDVAWANTTVEHDAHHMTRQEKLFEIADYVRAECPDLQLRACSSAGDNCGRCSKCARTEVGLLLAGLDPADHGYEFGPEKFDYIRAQLEEGNWHLGVDDEAFWKDLQNHVDPDGEYPYPGAESFFAWLRDADVEALVDRSTDSGSLGSAQNRAVYAVARNVPYPAYAGLHSAYSAVSDRL